MTVKHQPATPLPWESAGCCLYARSALAGKGIQGREVIAETRNADYPRFDEANASYLAHAACAYPKLVEALRIVLSDLDDEVSCGGRIPTDNEAVRAVLREIGEAP